jgi:hypothetical protein
MGPKQSKIETFSSEMKEIRTGGSLFGFILSIGFIEFIVLLRVHHVLWIKPDKPKEPKELKQLS